MLGVHVTASAATLALAPPRVIFQRAYAHDASGAFGSPFYDVAPGGRFLMVTSSQWTNVNAVVVLNWLEELKRLVPTK
jgi:hypothetical protein